jgi:hypothetical protein
MCARTGYLLPLTWVSQEYCLTSVYNFTIVIIHEMENGGEFVRYWEFVRICLLVNYRHDSHCPMNKWKNDCHCVWSESINRDQ